MDRLDWRLARASAVVVTVIFTLVHLTPLTPWVAGRMAVWDDPPAAHGTLIVLGAEQNADGTLGIMSYWRCVYALRAWRTGQFSKLLVSGGASNHLIKPDDPTTPNPLQLAGAMAEFLTALGVPKQDLIVEASSSSTHLNAIYSAPILRSLPGPYTLITSDFHTLRAQRCFRRAGIAVSSSPAPDILKRASDWRQRWQCSIVLAEEWVKLGYYWWKGWI
jgi:uncharacterized SAM-binding protein YcdF (DUF218 family)